MTLPNIITFSRLLLAFIAGLLFAFSYAEPFAVLLFLAATSLDAVDGWAARTFSQCSNLGKWVDPIVDKIIISLLYIVMAVKMHSFAFWIFLVLILLREVSVCVIRVILYNKSGSGASSGRVGKFKMICQSLFGNIILIYAYWLGEGFTLSEDILLASLGIILLLTYWSGYIVSRNAYRQMLRKEIIGRPDFESEYDKDERMVSGK